MLVDRFGRKHTALRLSVTDRCNLRCEYCMPVVGAPCSPKSHILDFEEVVFAVGVANELGIRRVRITGGEPLLRRDLSGLIRRLVQQTDLDDLALTSNGMLMPKYAQSLADAGLKRVNISVDSLNATRFEEITRFGSLRRVWEGVDAAVRAGLSPIKINTLILDGFNEDEVDEWVELTTRSDVTVRFMERMPIGEAVRTEQRGEFFDLTRERERLEERWGLQPAEKSVGNGPARYWRVPGAPGKIGFITPISHPYCNSCSRLRLSSTGSLRACLADDEEVDLRDAIRARDADAIATGIRRALDGKPRGHEWNDGAVTEAGMSSVGG